MNTYDNTGSIETISQHIDQLCEEYEQLFPEVQSLEGRINSFLDAYLQQVGPYFSPNQPKNPLPAKALHTNPAVNDNTAPEHISSQQALKTSPEVKRLHRTLVKHFHPDARQRSHINHDIMPRIQEAYAAGSLTRLQHIYYDSMLHELHDEGNQARLLQHYHDELEASVTSLHTHYQTLLRSAEYRLMRKSESAQKEGFNLAQQVIKSRQKMTPELEE